MMHALCEGWVRSLPPPRIIRDQDGVSPYLTRYYLGQPPIMLDGSSPFDYTGAERKGILEPSGPSLFLHKFHRGDNEMELHNHPWRWSISWILAGGYKEERRVGNKVLTYIRRPGTFNVLWADTFHRVDLLDGPCWTLFLAGPKTTPANWGFWNRDNDEFLFWIDFFKKKRAEKDVQRTLTEISEAAKRRL